MNSFSTDSLNRRLVPPRLVPPAYQKKIPAHYNVPVTLLGRYVVVGRDHSMKKRG